MIEHYIMHIYVCSDYCENTIHAPVGLAHTHTKCQKLHCSSVTMLSEM